MTSGRTQTIVDSIPVVAQALIFIAVVQVDPIVLGLLVGASVLGGWFGAGICSRLPVRPIQITMSRRHSGVHIAGVLRE